MDIEQIRKQFPILEEKINGYPLAYLDNAATTQKPNIVIDAMSTYYRTLNANVHRGVHTLGNRATEAFEKVRSKVKDFINAHAEEEIIFTRGTTSAINLVASSYQNRLQSSDEIVVTLQEHHSNLVPWQQLAKKTGAKLKYIPLEDDGTISLRNVRATITKKTKIVAITHVSNVLGVINPIREICQFAHEMGAITFVDGAQSAPHMKVDVQELDCDFFAFSGHKMCGPTGLGVLYGKKSRLDAMEPIEYGGEMVDNVSEYEATWKGTPWKFEGGTPLISEVITFGATLEFLQSIGMEQMLAHEKELTKYCYERLLSIPDVVIYGPNFVNRVGVIAFNIEGVHPHDVATVLDSFGIAVRAGQHCAQPLLNWFGVFSTLRVSFYIYNTKDEIDRLIEGIMKTREYFMC